MKILIIEDDELLLKAMVFQLEARGHTVVVCRNGDEALDMVMDRIFDLVICDLMIPVVSGITFLKVRKGFMGASVPVIVMSSLENAEAMLTELGLSYRCFLKKPIDFDQLFQLIEGIRKGTAAEESYGI